MIHEGVLDAAGSRAIAAYALHVRSAREPYGVFSTRRGPLMSAADQVRVTVLGRGGHGSQPHHAKDPIPAACEMVTALSTHVTRAHDIFDPVVITVGSFHAGIAHAHGLEVEIDHHDRYPVTVNDDAEAEFVAATIADLYGAERFSWMANPEPGSEDFSYVLAAVPGAFVFLSACPAELNPATAPTNHAPQARFDDGVLADGAALLTELAVRRLTRIAAAANALPAPPDGHAPTVSGGR